MGQFRWWVVGALVWTSGASGAELGTLSIGLDNIMVKSTFELDTRVGGYEQSSEVVSFDLSMQGQNEGKPPGAKSLSKRIRLSLNAPAPTTIQIVRRGKDAFIQFYVVVTDIQKMERFVTVEERQIKLAPSNTWEQFEKGNPIQAAIIDPREASDSRLGTESTARTYFENFIQDTLRERRAETSTPEIAIKKSPSRIVLLQREQIIILSTGASVEMKTQISSVAKPELKKPTSIQNSI